MKLVAYLMITLGLIAGALASATAYLVPIGDGSDDAELIDAELVMKSSAGSYDPTPDEGDEEAAEFAERVEQLHDEIDAAREAEQAIPTLLPDVDVDTASPTPVDTAPTGVERVISAEAMAPIARPEDPVTAELLTLLREDGVRSIRVKSFNLLRWPHNWLFGLGVLALLGGAFLIKNQRRATAKVSPNEEKTQKSDAHAAIDHIGETLRGLERDLPGMRDDSQRLDAINDRLGRVQRDDVPAFAAARPQIVDAIGLGGFAELMDEFAGMERQINRAWSAAADGETEESLEYVHAALGRLPSVEAKLPTS